MINPGGTKESRKAFKMLHFLFTFDKTSVYDSTVRKERPKRLTD